MIVYAESNFVLELALEQEEHAYAQRILSGAERKILDLVLPAFSIGEPFSTIAHRSRDRRQINNTISEQARALPRSRGPRRRDSHSRGKAGQPRRLRVAKPR
jgi:hypothetical protein